MPRFNSRGRSRTRSPTPRDAQMRSPTRSRSPIRSRSPARRSYSRDRPGHSPSPRRTLSPRYGPRDGLRNGGRRTSSRSYSRSRSRSPRYDRTTKIVVEKLTKNVNEGHLRELFEPFGKIVDMDLPMNRQYGTNRGTAYLLYSQESDAASAISHMHESQLDGAVISVSMVVPRRRFSPSPPPARRGPGFGGGGMRSGRAPEPKGRDRRSSGGPRAGYRADSYRPRTMSRSRSPIKRERRSRSYSRSRSPPRRRTRDSPERNAGRKRSLSRDSYDGRRTRSRSPPGKKARV